MKGKIYKNLTVISLIVIHYSDTEREIEGFTNHAKNRLFIIQLLFNPLSRFYLY